MRHEDYAGVVSRLLAVGIDVTVVTVAAAAGTALVVGGAEVMLGDTPDWVLALTGVCLGLLPTLYFALCWWITGQTAGGLAMGIAVRRTEGEPLGFPRSLIRAFLSLAFAPIWLIGIALAFVDERRRGLLDVVAGTVVVYQPERGELR